MRKTEDPSSIIKLVSVGMNSQTRSMSPIKIQKQGCVKNRLLKITVSKTTNLSRPYKIVKLVHFNYYK